MEMDLRRKVMGHFLKTRRERANLTQADVAKHLAYTSPQFVSNWERGVSLPPMDVLPRITDLYGISPKEMIDVVHRYQDRILKLQKKQLIDLFRNAKIS